MEFLSRAGGRHCFIPPMQESRIRKFRKSLKKTSRLLPETGRSQKQKIKWIEIHQSQLSICLLRGPLRWLMEQKNPKFLRSLQNSQCDTTNLAISDNFINFGKFECISTSNSLTYLQSTGTWICSEVSVDIINWMWAFTALPKIILHVWVCQKIANATTTNNSQEQPNIIRHSYQHQKISNN